MVSTSSLDAIVRLISSVRAPLTFSFSVAEDMSLRCTGGGNNPVMVAVDTSNHPVAEDMEAAATPLWTMCPMPSQKLGTSA